MKQQTNRAIREWGVALAYAILVVSTIMVFLPQYGIGFSHEANYRNVTIDATVNITNSPPTILEVRIQNNTGITLNAGGFQTVICNISVRDYNGGNTVLEANASFFNNFYNSSLDPDDNNSHFSNKSCRITNTNSFYRNFSCEFEVRYHAYNGTTWVCNATAYDDGSFNDTSSTTATVNSLLALNVTSPLNYGNLAAGDTSTNKSVNITNLGNIPINVTVYGYGNETDDNQSFICDQGNISMNYQKWSIDNTAIYSAKKSLSRFSTAPQNLNLTIPKQVNSSTEIINKTYWQLNVPLAAISGQCNGSIVFSAELS